MKPLFALAAALACTASPALAQQAAKTNDSGVPFCEIPGATVLALPDGRYGLNYFTKMDGSHADLVYAAGSPAMFDDLEPSFALLYSGLVADNGSVRVFEPFAISAALGGYPQGHALPPDSVRIAFTTGTLRSPDLTLSTISREEDLVNAALVAPNGALDGNDVETDKANLIALADSLLKNGGTVIMTRDGREVARVRIAPGAAEASRIAAIAFAGRALPWLKQGKCPNA